MSKILSFVKQLFADKTQEDQKWQNRINGLSKDTCEKLETLLKKDKFISLDFLCESNQGVILKAYSKKLKQDVALKVSRESRKSFESLQREYEIIKGIQDGYNIIQVHTFLFYEKYHISVLVMELCEMSLYEEMELLKQFNKWYTFEEISLIVIQISHALTQIHCNKIIHADVKPQNILKAQDGTYKLCDFGLSKRINQEFTSTKEMYGLTIKYSSPEQFKNFQREQTSINCKTDIFSLGLVILELLKYPLSDASTKSIRENKFEELKMDNFQYISLFSILRSKFFSEEPKSRISSYEIIYSLLQDLRFSERALSKLLTFTKSIQQLDAFDNSKHIEYILNIKLFYSMVDIFVFNNLSDSFIEQLHSSQTPQIQDNPLDKSFNDQSTNLFTSQTQNLTNSSSPFQDLSNPNPKQSSSLKQIQRYKFIALALSNAALNCEQLGKFKKAIILRCNARKVYSKIHQEGSIQIVLQYRHLCWNYYQIKEYQRSIKYGLKAIDMAKYILKGAPHITIAESHRLLAWSYQQVNKTNQGLDNAQKALNMFIQIHGEKPHKDIAFTLNTLGVIQSGVKNINKELEYKLQSLEMFQQLYKENHHPYLAAQLNNVGVAFYNANGYDKALFYYQKSLTMKRIIYGPFHYEIANTLRNILELQKKLKRTSEILLIQQELNSVKDALQYSQKNESSYFDMILFKYKGKHYFQVHYVNNYIILKSILDYYSLNNNHPLTD